MNTDEAVSDSETAAEDTDGADTEQHASQEPRHRPAEKRSEGRRRRRRGPKPVPDTTGNTEPTAVEGVQSTSAATLAAVDSDNGSDASDEEALFATIPSAQTTDA